MTHRTDTQQNSLIKEAGVMDSLQQTDSTEEAWIEVIHKMDSVYADLVHSQVELELKNTALEEAQLFINSVLSAMTDTLIVCDTEGVILQVNSALEKLTGKTKEDYLQHSLHDVLAEDSQDMLDFFPEKMRHESLIDCEVNVICSDGTTSPLSMNCSSRFDASGVLTGMVLIGRPIGELRHAYKKLNSAHTELQRTQQQLIHSEKMASLGRLIAGVAHELNNPISFIFGNMHALERYGSRINQYLNAVDANIDSTELKKLHADLKISRIQDDMGPLIEGSLEGAERVNNIIQDLRNYSGGQKEEYSFFELNSVIKKAVNWALKTDKIKPEIQYSLAENIKINSCKGQIHQVLVNLIQNARDAMENVSHPRLILSTKLSDKIVSIHVIDQGGGISEQDAKTLFDPFFTSKPVGQGTGLGLYISYGLAHDLKGDLTFKNNPQGGAEFILSLPVDRKELIL